MVQQNLFKTPKNIPKLINLKHYEGKPNFKYTYIGRPSIWGNPYSSKKSKFDVIKVDKHEALVKYEEYVYGSLLNKLYLLENKILGCFCVPKKWNLEIFIENPILKYCHGEVLIKLFLEKKINV